MANLDQPKGFEPWGNVIRACEYEAGSTVYPGDLVGMASDGQIDAAAAGAVILGVCLGYATVGQKVMVADHPDQLVACQADETEIDAQTDMGNMCDHLATAGNSTYKTSRHELDSSTVGSGQAGLQILRIEPVSGNALGEFVQVVCRINEHQLSHNIAGV